jgi:hypothetical protein
MKNIITLFSFILIITSCDVVEGPYLIDDGGITTVDTSSNTYVKKVLIEDFTGHTCPNCPAAARELEAIHDVYGTQIIGMALHVSTGFASPWTGAGKFEYDFRTKWGTDWDNFFDISNSGLPRGMVNRIGYPNEHKLGKNEWLAAVITELEKGIDFGIRIASDISGGNGTITINTELLNDVNGDYKLVVCLTESNIINWQKDGQTENEFYEHNHALRTVLLDESLSTSSSYTAGNKFERAITVSLSSLEQYNIDYSENTAINGSGNAGGWVAENMSVVAYIYNTITKEIVQVEEAHLTN